MCRVGAPVLYSFDLKQTLETAYLPDEVCGQIRGVSRWREFFVYGPTNVHLVIVTTISHLYFVLFITFVTFAVATLLFVIVYSYMYTI